MYLNIFGIIKCDNHYKGFTTFGKMTANKFVCFFHEFSFDLELDTFVVLDNVTIHRNKKIKEPRAI
ncbi:hypothetical protein HMPREF1199_01188 [Hoylesella oralis CC98A]|nr:hypothetical protein HMPREF1199_01188 [Hoylesella oralis CC98A]